MQRKSYDNNEDQKKLLQPIDLKIISLGRPASSSILTPCQRNILEDWYKELEIADSKIANAFTKNAQYVRKQKQIMIVFAIFLSLLEVNVLSSDQERMNKYLESFLDRKSTRLNS